jgi:hypothetical protein
LVKQKKWQEEKVEKVEEYKLPNNIEELKTKLASEVKFCSNDLT